MRKILLIVLFFIGSICYINAQRLYSDKNLQSLSKKDLNTYLVHSQKLKKTGAIITITGASLSAAGLIVGTIFGTNEFLGTGVMTGAYMFVFGIGGIITGIPILITGSSRVKKIYNAMYPNGGISFEIVPFRLYNSLDNYNQIGITFRMNF